MAGTAAEDEDEEEEEEQLPFYVILDAAWPQATVVFCRNAVGLTDIAVLGYLGTDELAAAAFAQMVITFSGITLWQGFGDALIALSSQAVGAQNPRLAGIWLQTSLLCICVAALPIGVVWWFTGAILALANVADNVQRLASLYARVSLLWLIPDALFAGFYQWLNGQQLVKPTIAINCFFVLFNLAVNVLLVHGGLGWPGLGFVGSPLATASTKILRGVVVVWWVCYMKELHAETWHPWTWSSVSRERIKVFMEQALPGAFAGLLEQGQFVTITLMVGSLPGTAQLAAHSGVLNTFSVVTCGMYGLTDAGASTVGFRLGNGDPLAAKRAAKALLICTCVMGCVVGALFLVGQHVIGRIFSTDPMVWHYASQISCLCGAAYFMLSLTFASFGTLQGQGRPSVAAVAMLFGLWGVSVPLAWWGLSHWGGLVGVWWGLVGGYASMTTIMVAMVARSDWQRYADEAMVRSERVPADAGDTKDPFRPLQESGATAEDWHCP